MARQRQEHLGGRAPRSLWERAGASAGDGASALFARLDAQDALDGRPDTQEATALSPEQPSQDVQRDVQWDVQWDVQAAPTREAAAAALEHLAARIRAGAWSDEIAALAVLAARLKG